MSIGAQYLVICQGGGGYLVPGRPLFCHRVATKFVTAELAHRSALRAGWVSPDNGKTHFCPEHTPGGHVHDFKYVASYPIGPDPADTETVMQCGCGQQSHWTSDPTKED